MRCCHSTLGLLFRGSAGFTRKGQQQFATQTLRVHLLGLDSVAKNVFTGRFSFIALHLRFQAQFQNFCLSRAAKRGGFKRGGFPIWTCPSFFVLFCPFWDFPDFSGIFPICSGMVWGLSRFVLFLFLAYYEHLRGTVPEGSATQSGPFPKKVGNTRVWKHPGLASLNFVHNKNLEGWPRWNLSWGNYLLQCNDCCCSSLEATNVLVTHTVFLSVLRGN